MSRAGNVARVFGLAVLCFLACNRVASASHLHGGTLSWQQDTSHVDPNNVKIWITVTAARQWSLFYPGVGANPPVGTTIPSAVFLQLTGFAYSSLFDVPVVVQSVLPSDDLLVASGSVALIIPKAAFPVTVRWTDCCRADTLTERNNDLDYFLSTVIDLNPATGATRSPIATAPLRVHLPLNVTSTFQLPSVAFEGLTNTFRFAPPATSGLQTPRPNGTVFCTTGQCTDLHSQSPPYSLGMQLTAAGVITWLPQLPGLYAAQFTITSIDANGVPRASVPLDMEFEVLVLCAPGTYSATGEPPCTPAPAGSFVSAYGSTSATPCPAGTFSGFAGAAACTPAPLGYYVSAAGSTSATACPAGTFSAVTGAVACTAAPIGYYVDSPGSSSPTPCPPGTFSSVPGAAACTPAPLGYYVSAPGSAAPAACPAGTWSAGGAPACTSVKVLLDQAVRAYLGDTGVATSLRQQIESIASAPNGIAKAGKLGAFINRLNALRGKALTPEQADDLTAFANLL